MRAHIYKLTNKRNGFIYIGSTKHDIADRFYQHWKQRRSYDKPLYQAMCETEREDWSVELLATVDAKDRWNVEKEMTLYFRETASGCYNIYDGYTKSGAKNPMYGKQHSAVSKEKMSAALSGRKISAAGKEKMSAAQRGDKNARATAVYDTQTGITYSTCKECAAAIDKSNMYIHNHPERFIYERKKYMKKQNIAF